MRVAKVLNFGDITYLKNLIEIIMLIQTYQNDMKMVLDRYTALQEGFGVKLRHM
jgi:hypothetical protein